jgi:hypothetical protein
VITLTSKRSKKKSKDALPFLKTCFFFYLLSSGLAQDKHGVKAATTTAKMQTLSLTRTYIYTSKTMEQQEMKYTAVT